MLLQRKTSTLIMMERDQALYWSARADTTIQVLLALNKISLSQLVDKLADIAYKHLRSNEGMDFKDERLKVILSIDCESTHLTHCGSRSHSKNLVKLACGSDSNMITPM